MPTDRETGTSAASPARSVSNSFSECSLAIAPSLVEWISKIGHRTSCHINGSVNSILEKAAERNAYLDIGHGVVFCPEKAEDILSHKPEILQRLENRYDFAQLVG